MPIQVRSEIGMLEQVLTEKGFGKVKRKHEKPA